jgi:hypothetical protein
VLKFPQQSRLHRLRAYVRTADTVHLFVNDVDTSRVQVADGFKEPPKSTGYRPVKVSPDAWRVEPLGDVVRAICAPVSWTFKVVPPLADGTKSLVVYGHYALDASGTLLWSERFGEEDKDGSWIDMPFDVLRPDDRLDLALVVDQKEGA